MRTAPSLQQMVAVMDRYMMPDVQHLSVSPVCVQVEAEVSAGNMDAQEAREIMIEIDAKSSALLAVLAIILAASAFVFSLSQTYAALILMFLQVSSISASIIFLLRCLIYEPSPRLRHVFELDQVADEFYLQVEAIKQVRYFNRVIVLTVVTSVLFFIMSLLVAVDAMFLS
ncbi:MAG: hypothetical protein ACPGID_13800 [Rubricella sp.]